MKKFLFLFVFLIGCGGNEKVVDNDLCYFTPGPVEIEGKLVETTCPEELLMKEFSRDDYIYSNEYLECNLYYLTKRNFPEVLGCVANVSVDLTVEENTIDCQTQYEYICNNFICYALYSVKVVRR